MRIPVVIADSSQPRAMFLESELVQYYRASVERVESWEALLEKLEPTGGTPVHLVILAVDLNGGGGPPNEQVAVVLDRLRRQRGQVILMVNNPSFQITPQPGLHLVRTLALSDWRLREGEWGQARRDCLSDPLPETVVRREPADDRILIEMVRSLGRDGDLERGEKVLSVLVRDLWKCQTAQVHRLTQGYSAATVFRCDLDSVSSLDSFALKISSASDDWRIENELGKWVEIEGKLNLQGLKRFLPQLVAPQIPSDANPRWASSGGFSAVAYQFLGAAAGTFLSLQDAHRFPVTELQRITQGTPAEAHATRLPNFVLEQVIGCLGPAWYQSAQVVNDQPLWSAEDATVKKVLQPPPYKLTSRQKAHLLGCLETFEKATRLGPRMLKDAWQESRLVVNWLRAKPGDGLIPASPQVAVVSPVHGDLNSQNILLWVDQAQPFLIDFAGYQSRGHTFQDFARLETEVKFALMEQESDSPWRALDYTDNQFETWCQTEGMLASLNWEANLSLRGKSPCVRRGLEMIRFVRGQARKVHNNVFAANSTTDSAFLRQYFPALLYQTLRTIGYESLSPFKRLLAVYSAARLIRFLTDK